ncbi:endolytic transglycosylase MltG [Limibaculum sp. M0105]|uniref:Endolytic murein transglycosylase n=1 Tax=Thermohalobaculum xanthum TaxID=2753746 RepID=A0A8J7S9W8_9RHOB|nr:endolytic transglycosylase MltG [Thermohalobaculum xanthum]MBK0397693.1 endolytic transglycosylase MltG [Thermohalobaculum xanthum]
MRHLAANVLSILIVLGIVLVGAVFYAQHAYRAPGPLEADQIFVVERGMSLRRASEQLEAEGIITDDRLFRLGARYSGQAEALRFGEYMVPAGASMSEVLALITSGRTITHKVTVAEGLTSWQIVELLREVDVLEGELDDVPPEGSLAPNTYFVHRGDTRAEVLARMQEDQKAILDEAWAARAPGLPLSSAEEVLILASIVEKETGVPEERGRVASVFVNRLKKGMKLQSDPTIIYGLTEGKGPLGRGIRKSELEKGTPYNTYVIDGLPPTPIANPGREAIMAAVNPDETNFLYFVADGSGGHAFAETLSDHNRNVQRWRQIERERQQNQNDAAKN